MDARAGEGAKGFRHPADLLELRLKTEMGEMISRTDVLEVNTRILSAARAKFLLFPSVWSDRAHKAAKTKGPSGVEKVLQTAVDEVLTELSWDGYQGRSRALNDSSYRPILGGRAARPFLMWRACRQITVLGATMNTTLKTLAEIRSEGACPECGRFTVSLHLYPPEPGGMAKCHNLTCDYVEWQLKVCSSKWLKAGWRYELLV